MKRRAFVGECSAVAMLALASCYAKEGEPAASAEPDLGEPLQFTFGTLDGTELSSDTTRGRTTALLFVTTYDLPSQAEAQLLGDVLSTHKPLANAATAARDEISREEAAEKRGRAGTSGPNASPRRRGAKSTT